MLVRLLYASRSVVPITQEFSDSLLLAAQQRNAQYGITGILCVCTEGNVFLQALEGGRTEVNRLYQNLMADQRHNDVTLLSYADVEQRAFSSWRMGRIDLNRVNTGTILRYSPRATLDPFELSGTAAMAMLMELATTTTVISRPGPAR